MPSPVPISFIETWERLPKIEKTKTITIAALVMTPAVVLSDVETASSVDAPFVDGLANAAEDEDVVVHRQAKRTTNRNKGIQAVMPGRPEPEDVLAQPHWKTATMNP